MCEWMQVIEELITLGKIVCPTVITGLLLYSKSIISMMFLGHLGDEELAGGSLSIAFANITGYSVLKGLAMGMEPICSQAFGAKKWLVLSQTYNRTVFLLSFSVIPICLLWLKMESILLWSGQEPSITSVARVFLTYSIPELLSQAYLNPLTIFLRTQGLTKPLTMSATCAMILHLPINYLLVVYLNMGVKGVALASGFYSVNVNLGLLLYLLVSRKAIKPWDGGLLITYFQGWQPLLSFALPSVCSICLEWWWYEVMLLLCGLLSNPKASVAAMGVLIQTTGLLYVFPSSLSMSLSNRIGHELGADQPARAKRATLVGLTVAIVCGLLACIFTILVRNVWGKLYSSDKQILTLTSVALPIVGLCELGNNLQTASYGILSGSARPNMGAYINFSSFYLVGLPVATLLCFRLELGFVGLWLGLAAAQTSCMSMMVYTLLQTDWREQAKRAKELTQATEAGKNDLEQNLLS